MGTRQEETWRRRFPRLSIPGCIDRRRKLGEPHNGRGMRIPKDATSGRIWTSRNEYLLGGTRKHTGAHVDEFGGTTMGLHKQLTRSRASERDPWSLGSKGLRQKVSRQYLNKTGSKVGVVEVPSLFPRRYPVEDASVDSEDPRTDLVPRRSQQEGNEI